MPTPESQTLRDAIRSGAICHSKDRDEWESAIARVYQLEEIAESSTQREPPR